MKLKRIILFTILSILLIFNQAYATVSSSTSRIKHTCNGILTGFTFTFGVNETEEVEVIHTDSGGTETTLTETTHYAISCTNNDCSAGGTCTTVDTYALGEYITILRSVPLTQESDFTEGMATLYETFENELDKGRRIDQQLQEQITRTPKLSRSSAYAANDYTFPDPDSGKIIGWNAGATDLTTFTPSSATTIDITTLERISDYGNNLSTAVTAIGATEKTLLIDVATSGDTTVPSNIDLWFIRGGSLTGTVTVYSPENIIASPTQTIFDVASSINFTTGGTVYPEWWGAARDGATNDSTALQAALNAFTNGGIVQLSTGTYDFATGLTQPTKVHLIGMGSRNSILHYTGADKAIYLNAASAYVVGAKIADLSIDGSNAKAIVLSASASYSLTECLFENLYLITVSHGIYLNNTPLTTVYKNKFRNIKIYVVSAYGIWNDGGPYNSWDNIEITNVGDNAYAIKNQGANFTFSNISVDGVIDDAGGDGIWSEVRIETIDCTTPPLNMVFRASNGNTLINGLVFTDVDPAKCDYGLDLAGTGNVINKMRFNGTIWPTYPVTLNASSSGTLNQVYKGTTATAIDAYTASTILDDWLIIGGDLLGTQKLNYANGFQTLADDATPTVIGGTLFLTGGTVTITDFDDGMTGQIIRIVAEHSITITDGTNILLDGSANWAMTATDTLTLLCKLDGKWYELGRGDNGA